MILLSKNEKKFILLLARTGYYCNSYRKHFSIYDSSIDRLLKSKFVEKKGPIIIFGKMMNIYILTSKGKDLVRNHFLIRPYSGKSDQLEHDYVLGKVYLMISETEKDTWITETDLGIMHPNESVIDGLYVNNNGEKVGVEILTESYNDNMIEERNNFIKKYCNKKIVIHTKELR